MTRFEVGKLRRALDSLYLIVLQRSSSTPPRPIPVPQRNIPQISLESSYQISPSNRSPRLQLLTSYRCYFFAIWGHYRQSNYITGRSHATGHLKLSHGDLECMYVVGGGRECDAVSAHMSTGDCGVKSVNSIEEDKLRTLSNQLVVASQKLFRYEESILWGEDKGFYSSQLNKLVQPVAGAKSIANSYRIRTSLISSDIKEDIATLSHESLKR